MFYKPPASTSNGDVQPTDKSSPSETDRHDSGLGSLDYQRDLNTDSMTSVSLGSISEEGVHADPVTTISGKFSDMVLNAKELGNGSSCVSGKEMEHVDKGLDTGQTRLESQSEMEHDSGHYESISSGIGSMTSMTTATFSNVSPVPSSVVQSAEGSEDLDSTWVSTILQLSYPAEKGTICMENVVRMFQGNKDGDNWLNLAIIHEAQEAAYLLIDLSPDHDWLNLYNHLRQTPLHLAVLARQPGIVRRLVCAGASVWEQDLMGNTPLHLACTMGSEELVRHFVTPVRLSETIHGRQRSYRLPFQKLPQNTGLRNFDGETCLHLAVRAGHVNVVRILLENGCDPNIGDGKSGRTVLHHCAQSGHLELTSLLLSRRGTQCDIMDYGMFTPLDLAQGHHELEIMRLLASHGATWRDQWSDSDPEGEDEDSEMDDEHCSG